MKGNLKIQNPLFEASTMKGTLRAKTHPEDSALAGDHNMEVYLSTEAFISSEELSDMEA
ncbi:hypothetical protein Scep_014245 [Stephania cephalantha]|uniref:Uncharacterized protein n=1 Tax=Stephania cephalantha TaxID=152367 RepID=A0AAP0J0X1_9MAGN